MQDKTKKKLKIAGWIIGACLLLASIVLFFGFVLQKDSGYRFPIFNYNNGDKVVKTSNDGKITLDGKLNEEVWNKKNKLEVSMEGNDNVSVVMSSHFTDEGIYIALDVKDMGVYYSQSRDSFANSCIELYASSVAGAYDLNSGDAYEIDLGVNGVATVKKFMNSAYTLWPMQIDMSVVTKGDINTAECTGYVIEALLPYSMFGGECEFIYANPAIVRTFSTGDEQRQWYNFGIEKRQVEWEKALHWWQFNTDGLIAHDVAIKEVKNGTVNGQNYVVDGDDYRFEICPQDGYYAKSVKVGKKDVTNDLVYSGGVTYYVVERVKEDITVEVVYEKLPSETVPVKGRVVNSEGTGAGIIASVINGGYAVQATVNEDGTFEVIVPKVDGLRLNAYSEGHISNYKNVIWGQDVNMTLKKENMGANTNVTLATQYEPRNWDFDRQYKNRIRSVSRSVRNVVLNTDIYSTTAFASADITLPIEKGVDTRAGFSFVDKDGHDVFVCLVMSYETHDYSYQIQVITDGGETWSGTGWIEKINPIKEVEQKANSETGLPFAVLYKNGSFTIWVDNSIAGQDVKAIHADNSYVFKSDTKVAVGLQTWYNTAAFNNLVIGTSKPSSLSYMPKRIVTDESGQFRFNNPNIANSKYVVLSAHVKALGTRKSGICRTAGLGIAAKGPTRDDIYGFHMAYDHPSYEYFVSVNNGNNVGNNPEKWYDVHPDNHATGRETNQLFTEQGVDVKLVRMDRTVYLLAEYDGVWQQIGFLVLPEGQKTELSFFNLGLSSLYTDINVKTGKAAAMDAMTNLTVKPNGEFFMFQYMVDDTNWTVDMKITDKDSSNDNVYDSRLAVQVSSIVGAPKEDVRHNLRFFKQGSDYHTFHSSESPWTGHEGIVVPENYIKAMQEDGLYVRYVRNGDDLHVLFSVDGKEYNFQQTLYDYLSNESGLIRIEFCDQFIYENLSIKAGEKAAINALS